MKSFLTFVLVFLAGTATVFGQDYGKLKGAAEEVRKGAESVARSAADSFRKGRQNSTDSIEHAFLAEQALAASRLMERIVTERYDIGDLRLAANVLSEMSERFPTDSRWGSLKEKIDSLVFELGRGVVSSSVATPPDDGPDIPEDRILGRFFWNGEVDAEVHLAVRGTSIESATMSGRTLPEGTFSFTSALPEEEGIIVRVKKFEGRGEATVIRQPVAANGYTAVVRIWDGDGGSKPYSIEIYWYRASQ